MVRPARVPSARQAARTHPGPRLRLANTHPRTKTIATRTAILIDGHRIRTDQRHDRCLAGRAVHHGDRPLRRAPARQLQRPRPCAAIGVDTAATGRGPPRIIPPPRPSRPYQPPRRGPGGRLGDRQRPPAPSPVRRAPEGDRLGDRNELMPKEAIPIGPRPATGPPPP